MILLIVPAVCASLLTAFWFHRSSRRTNGKLSAPVASVVLLRRMLTDERVGRGTKTILALPVCYLLSPIQVIPNFIPVLGQLDDVLVAALGRRPRHFRLSRLRWGGAAGLSALAGMPYKPGCGCFTLLVHLDCPRLAACCSPRWQRVTSFASSAASHRGE